MKNYIEKIFEWHKYPINAALHLIALIILIFSLWNHSWIGIVVAFIIALVGHLIQETHDHKNRINELEKNRRKK